MARRGQSGLDGVTHRSGWWLCLLALIGCSDPDTGPAHLDEYLERLSTVTGVELTSSAPFESGRFDLPREQITLFSSSDKIDLIDFLSLSGCELQVNLGRRNTQLGRTASPSQRLLLDLEFMDLAPECITLLRERGDDELASTLAAVSEEREAQLPDSIAQAVLMGPEWQLFWERPATLGTYPTDTNSAITESLSQLADLTRGWLGGNWQANNREFELLLSALRAGDGGALVAAHSLASRELERANTLLAAAQATAPLCPFGNHTDRSKSLEQVVARFFVGAVQPWLVRLRQRAELLLAPVTNLEAPLSAAFSPQYRAWVIERDHLLNNQTELIRAHIANIQATLAPCGPD
jgi:hypothetical protein